ncbi:Maff2 family protein, partial [Dysosmobacter welbionis]
MQGTGANYASSGGSLLDLMRSVDTANSFSTKRANQEAENAAHYREMLKRGTLDDGTPITASMRKQLETLAAR